MLLVAAPLAVFENEVLLIGRVILGVTMVYYGWPKLKDLRSNAKDFVAMGFNPGWFWGTIVIFIEFFGGLLMLAGVYAWVAALLMAGHMTIGATWKKLKTDKPFSDWSYDLLLLALALLIATFGAGSYNLVAWL